MLVVVVVVLSAANLDRFALLERGNFLSRDNIVNILRASAPLLTLAGAFTLLMVSGHIDLSVGSAMSLCAVVYAMLALEGVPFLPAIALATILGVGLGAINGLLVVRLHITPVIATLITLSLYKGIALLLVAGRGICDQVGRRALDARLVQLLRPRAGAAGSADGLLGRSRCDDRAADSAGPHPARQVHGGDRGQCHSREAVRDQHPEGGRHRLRARGRDRRPRWGRPLELHVAR